ncbi:MAG: hypothetical protein MAG794_01293 [Gammaproteobacteria bacterium]|nr:hypothetical protein [Gammaproteobacteria bacterium]
MDRAAWMWFIFQPCRSACKSFSIRPYNAGMGKLTTHVLDTARPFFYYAYGAAECFDGGLAPGPVYQHKQ